VLDDCSVAGGSGPAGWSLDFGTYQLGAPASATFTTTLYCTKGTIVSSVTLDGGLHYSASTRHMSDGASHLLPYKIYVNPCASGNAEWSGDDTPPAFQSVTSTSVRSALGGAACGTIDAGSNAPAGYYSDVVTLTVNFT
jgi:spore coat protein U-like protein